MLTGPNLARADAALRQLCTPSAAAFGVRLLDRAVDNVVTFGDFVATARDLIRADPDQSATWLAALVALDMQRSQAGDPREHRDPSRN